MKLFDTDGIFYRAINFVFELLLLNLIWFVSVLITLGIGFGASTTALLYAVDKTMVKKEGHILTNFYKGYKLNFLKATISWIILALPLGIISVNIFILDLSQLPLGLILYFINYLVLYQLILVSIFIFPLIAKVELGKIKQYFVTAFKLGNGHILITIGCLALFFLTGLLLRRAPIYIFVVVSVTAMIVNNLFEYLLKKYLVNDLKAGN